MRKFCKKLGHLFEGIFSSHRKILFESDRMNAKCRFAVDSSRRRRSWHGSNTPFELLLQPTQFGSMDPKVRFAPPLHRTG